jgi:hypothetical protein
MRKKIERLDTPWGRAYVIGEGSDIKFLPSVTTVLSLVSSTYLVELEEKIGKEELKKIGDKALLRNCYAQVFGELCHMLGQNWRSRKESLLHTAEEHRRAVGRHGKSTHRHRKVSVL